MSAKRGKWGDVPHAYEVLHHELVEGLGRVGHVNFSWSVSEIGLQVGVLVIVTGALADTHLLRDVCDRGRVIKVEACRPQFRAN